ncbi:MAG: hypothetical protein V4635_00885 [Bacteroidota bacterium]
MTTQEIKTNWDNLAEKANPLTSKDIDSFGLSDQTVTFLKQCGLPSQSAPFLSFVDNSNRELDTINSISNLYELPKEFDRYINIGGDGSGNPIVINTKKNDIIELLDHEQDFEPLDFMNTNVFSLSACLIAYKTFVKTVIETNGSSAFLDSNFTDQQFEIVTNIKNRKNNAYTQQRAIASFLRVNAQMHNLDLQKRTSACGPLAASTKT